MQEQITKFYGSVHSILTYCDVNKELVAYRPTLLELLKSKCTLLLFYGLHAININITDKIREAIINAWN